MDKIPSFTVNHLDLLTGIYVSRTDSLNNEKITTFDLRFTRPNTEPVMDAAAVHTIEHLAATYLRNHSEWKQKVIYFGPMGCRTGFYLILWGDFVSEDIIGLVNELLQFIINFDVEIPGATAKDCGNYLEMNLSMAKWYAKKYLDEAVKNPQHDRLNYPEK